MRFFKCLWILPTGNYNEKICQYDEYIENGLDSELADISSSRQNVLESENSFFEQELLTCRPARAERETAFAFAFPESFPALPPA